MRNLRLGWRRAEHGYFTLIGLLVVLVIIGILFAMYAGSPGGGGSSGTGGAVTVLGGAKNRASDAVCRNNLMQVRAAISLYQANAGVFPPSLDSLESGVTLTCVVGDEPYEYDPNSGKVHCVHPGHERF